MILQSHAAGLANGSTMVMMFVGVLVPARTKLTRWGFDCAFWNAYHFCFCVLVRMVCHMCVLWRIFSDYAFWYAWFTTCAFCYAYSLIMRFDTHGLPHVSFVMHILWLCVLICMVNHVCILLCIFSDYVFDTYGLPQVCFVTHILWLCVLICMVYHVCVLLRIFTLPCLCNMVKIFEYFLTQNFIPKIRLKKSHIWEF